MCSRRISRINQLKGDEENEEKIKNDKHYLWNNDTNLNRKCLCRPSR